MTDEKVDRKGAAMVAAETLRHTAFNRWNAEREWMKQSRGGELTIHETAEKLGTVSGEAFNVAMQVLVDQALHAPKIRDKRAAAEIIARVHMQEIDLRCKYVEQYQLAVERRSLDPSRSVTTSLASDATTGDGPAPLQALPRKLTEEEMTAMIQARRKKVG